jgi:Putative Actinobacterial Holin-X, holin superfamily III
VSVRDGNGGGSGGSETNGAAEGGPKRPLGTVAASAIDGARALLRKHVELAKLEVSEAASVRAAGAGMMGAAGVVAAYALGFFAAAGAAALALVLPAWAAILIVGVLLIAIAGVLVLAGRRTIRTAPPPAERTRASLKEGARWAKQQIAR